MCVCRSLAKIASTGQTLKYIPQPRPERICQIHKVMIRLGISFERFDLDLDGRGLAGGGLASAGVRGRQGGGAEPNEVTRMGTKSWTLNSNRTFCRLIPPVSILAPQASIVVSGSLSHRSLPHRKPRAEGAVCARIHASPPSSFRLAFG